MIVQASRAVDGLRHVWRNGEGLDDDLLRGVVSEQRLQKLQQRFAGAGDLPSALIRLFRRAQRKTERRQALQRRQLLFIEHQRQKLYTELGADYYLDVLE